MNKIFNARNYKRQNNARTLVSPIAVGKNGSRFIISIEEDDNKEAMVFAENQKNGDVMYISLRDLTYIMRYKIMSEMAMLLFSEIAEGKKNKKLKTYAKH